MGRRLGRRLPGDGIGEVDGALGKADRAGGWLEYVRPTHEELCALMATAHAKFTAELLGFTGIRLTDDQAGDAWDEAFAHQGVTLIDAFGTRNAPPLPAKLSNRGALGRGRRAG